MTVHTDAFRAYKPLEEHGAFASEYVDHSDGEYVGKRERLRESRSLTCRWFSLHQAVSKDRSAPDLRAFQLHHEMFRKQGEKLSKHPRNCVVTY